MIELHAITISFFAAGHRVLDHEFFKRGCHYFDADKENIPSSCQQLHFALKDGQFGLSGSISPFQSFVLGHYQTNLDLCAIWQRKGDQPTEDG